MAAMPVTNSLNTHYSTLLKLAIFTIFIVSAIDYTRLMGFEWGPGWDFKCNCDAAYTLFRGGNPYRVREYSFILNGFTYLPFWLPVHGALCKVLNVTDIKTTIVYYPFYISLFLAALWFALSKLKFSSFDRLFLAVVSLSGLGGFLWTVRTGNMALFEAIAFLFAMVYLVKFEESRDQHDRRRFAALFGCFMAVKTGTLVFILLIALLPASRRDRIETALIAGAVACVPILLSYLFYPELMKHYYLMLGNKIEGNVNPYLRSPSIYWGFIDIFADSKLPLSMHWTRILAEGIAILLLVVGVGIVLGVRSLRSAIRQKFVATSSIFGFKGTAFDVFLLVFIFIQLVLPRLKEYSYLLTAISIAFLIVRLRTTPGEKIVLAIFLAIPVFDGHATTINASGLLGNYAQLYVAIGMFFYVLSRYCPPPTEENAAAHAAKQSEPAYTSACADS